MTGKTMIDESKLRLAILKVLEDGDEDNQPWAFYVHDHGGLKGYEWSDNNAMAERVNFAQAVIEEAREP